MTNIRNRKRNSVSYESSTHYAHLSKPSQIGFYITLYPRGRVIPATFSFNLSRIIVAFQVERVVDRITTACSTYHAIFSVASCDNMLRI